MRPPKQALLLLVAVSVISAGCLGSGSIGLGSEAPVSSPAATPTETQPASPSPATETAASDGSDKPYWAIRNNQSSTAYQVTVYVADGKITNRTYVLQNGTTVTRAFPPTKAPPSNVTEIRPTTEVLWSGTYVVKPNSSLVIRFENMPSSATLMEVIVPNSSSQVMTEYMSGQTTEQCSIQLIDHSEPYSSATSKSMSGCSYEYETHVHETNTTYTTVTIGADNETTGG